MINKITTGSLYAVIFGYLTIGVTGAIADGLYIGFVIGLITIPFIFIAAFILGLILKPIELKTNASIWLLLIVYISIGAMFSPVVQILIFGNNPLISESWVFEIYISYVKIGIMSALGAWYGSVYKTHNKSINRT